MNRDRGSNSAKVRKPRVKTSASSARLDIPKQAPPLARSNTLPVNHTTYPRVPRANSLGFTDNNEKARSDDGFHSDSDKDSNQSANSNISIRSGKNYLIKTPSIKSDVVAKVRPKSSLGTMSDNSSSDKSKVEPVDDIFRADRQAGDARKNRKIEDLEISIKSLMKVNVELEASNKKQAAEIQALKRKLHMYVEIDKENDARFRRICMVIDELTRDANDALNYTSKIGGSRVLSSAQLDSDNMELQSHYKDQSSKISDNVILHSSKNLKIHKYHSAEKSNSGTIAANKITSSSSEINKQTSVINPKIISTTEKDNTNSTTVQTSNLPLAEPVEENNKRLQANIERARTVVTELLSLEKKDNNNVNNNNTSSYTPHNSERKGLSLLLPSQNDHSKHMTHSKHVTRSSIGGSDSPQPSPRMILLYELQESLGIGNAESSKYLKENRRSLPVMSSSKIKIISPPEEESQEGDDSRPIRSQTQTDTILRRRSSPNFRTSSFSLPKSNMLIGVTDHASASFVKNDDSVLNSHTHGPNVEKRSILASSWVYITTPFRTE
ncbi:10834_t:CDS:2 [Funneliformis geosporum]|nr:10834_t:CDS:2 [Funneliformis geosporum]